MSSLLVRLTHVVRLLIYVGSLANNNLSWRVCSARRLGLLNIIDTDLDIAEVARNVTEHELYLSMGR